MKLEKSERAATGVLVPLAPCYVPTCAAPCYSISCPRRLLAASASSASLSSQLSSSSSKLSASSSSSSATVVAVAAAAEASQSAPVADPETPTTPASAADAPPPPQKLILWSTSVPKDVLESVSNDEVKRQEVIFELISGEREYVLDLEAVIRIFVEPLASQPIIPEHRRIRFIRSVFLNIEEIYRTNASLARKLTEIQSRDHVVDGGIGAAFLDLALQFEAYVDYGGKQILAKSLLKHEQSENSDLCQYLQDCLAIPELRKLPLESFLASPTTRFARYPLLIKETLKRTPADHPEREPLQEAIAMLESLLTRLNKEAGRSENMLRLVELSRSVIQPDTTGDTLRLSDPGRKFIREGKLVLKRHTGDYEVTLLLFDHALAIARKKDNDAFKLIRRAIPIELVSVKLADVAASGPAIAASASANGGGTSHTGNNVLTSLGTSSNIDAARSKLRATDPSRQTPPIFTLICDGRDAASITLQAPNLAQVEAWIEAIHQQKMTWRKQHARFEPHVIWTGPVDPAMHDMPTSSVVWDGKLVVSGQNGVYVMTPSLQQKQQQQHHQQPQQPQLQLQSGLKPRGTSSLFKKNIVSEFRKVIDLPRVTKVDVIRDSRMLLVLSDRTLYAYPVDVVANATKSNIDQAAVMYRHPSSPARVALSSISASISSLTGGGHIGIAGGSGSGDHAVDGTNHAYRGRKIASPVSFFKQGIIANQPIVCTVDSKPLNSDIRVWRPHAPEPHAVSASTHPLARFFGNSNHDNAAANASHGHSSNTSDIITTSSTPHTSNTMRNHAFGIISHDPLRPFKRLYVPSETRCIDYLNSMLVVGSSKGFEIVQLSTLKTQPLLDEKDAANGFVVGREVQVPVAVFRLSGVVANVVPVTSQVSAKAATVTAATTEAAATNSTPIAHRSQSQPQRTNTECVFLLCYQDVAFLIDKFGRRVRDAWIMYWHGTPTDFVLSGSMLLAIGVNMIEVCDVGSGSLVQILMSSEVGGYGHDDSLGHDASSTSTTSSSVLPKPTASPCLLSLHLSKNKSTHVPDDRSTTHAQIHRQNHLLSKFGQRMSSSHHLNTSAVGVSVSTDHDGGGVVSPTSISGVSSSVSPISVTESSVPVSPTTALLSPTPSSLLQTSPPMRLLNGHHRTMYLAVGTGSFARIVHLVPTAMSSTNRRSR